MTRKGIAVAGCTLVDVIKMIDGYPAPGMLARIDTVNRATGGLVPNVALNLRVMDPTLPLSVWGALGEDENADFVRRTFEAYGIDTEGLLTVPGGTTGFTDVMTVKGTGERTFFSMEGANAAFCPDDAMLDAIAGKADLLHIGYILLMPGLDAADDVYGTRLARVLHMAREKGLRTSIDAVSRPGASEKILPALRETDYVIMNEIEVCAAFSLDARDADGKLIRENVLTAMENMLALGVREAVIVHCPTCGFFRRRGEKPVCVPSLKLPDGWIKGSVGAGDAFCAACLLGLEEGWSGEAILSFASAAAAYNLSAADAVSGMRSLAEIRALEIGLPRCDAMG